MKAMILLFLIAVTAFVSTQSTYVPSSADSIDIIEQMEDILAEIEESKEDDSERNNAAFEAYEPSSVTKKEALATAFRKAVMAGTDDFELTAAREPFTYTCPPGAALSYMYSEHDNSVEDRKWRFGCRKISTMHIDEECSWSENNEFDQPMSAICASGFVATGFRSPEYSTGAKDRQYNVQCCKTDQVEECCTTTPEYINDYDAVMDYTAPEDHVITGVESVHDNGREDRRFKVKVCKVKKVYNDCSC